MRLVEKIILVKPAGRNRVYEIELLEDDRGCVVNHRYGWEGSALEDGTRTPDPVPRADAERIMQSLRLSCERRGYFEKSTDRQRPASAPVAVAQGQGAYAAALMSRLQRLPGLKDRDAARPRAGFISRRSRFMPCRGMTRRQRRCASRCWPTSTSNTGPFARYGGFSRRQRPLTMRRSTGFWHSGLQTRQRASRGPRSLPARQRPISTAAWRANCAALAGTATAVL